MDNKKSSYEIISEKAERYISDIEKLLCLETAPNSEIKQGVEKIRLLVDRNPNVTYHQIRNIHTLVKKAKNINELNLIRPKLAYVSARQKDDNGKIIVTVIDKLIVKVTDEKNEEIKIKKIRGLNYIMESIVAYYKFYYGEK